VTVENETDRDLNHEDFPLEPESELSETLNCSLIPLIWEIERESESLRDLKRDECSARVESTFSDALRDLNREDRSTRTESTVHEILRDLRIEVVCVRLETVPIEALKLSPRPLA